MARTRSNPAAERVRDWDRVWSAYIHGLQTRDHELVEDGRRAMAAFDRSHGLPELRLEPDYATD